jgi:sigma-B regulation protein RsbU (phosphoserine phosphatase)
VSSADLERAREVQVSYLPREFAVTDRYEIFGYNQSAALVGGDYFDYFCREPESIQFVVADACGHGLAAAFTMCTFRGMLHAAVEHSSELDTLFDALNRRLYVGTDHLQYLTGVFCDYAQPEGRLRYFNAGHFAPLLIRTDGTAERLPGRGRPLGMFSDSTYEIQSWPVSRGDLLVLFTDGLFEIRNAREEYFGVDGILSTVLEHRRLSLRELAGEVLRSAARFSHTSQPDDDITLFLVRFL